MRGKGTCGMVGVVGVCLVWIVVMLNTIRGVCWEWSGCVCCRTEEWGGIVLVYSGGVGQKTAYRFTVGRLGERVKKRLIGGRTNPAGQIICPRNRMEDQIDDRNRSRGKAMGKEGEVRH